MKKWLNREKKKVGDKHMLEKLNVMARCCSKYLKNVSLLQFVNL